MEQVTCGIVCLVNTFAVFTFSNLSRDSACELLVCLLLEVFWLQCDIIWSHFYKAMGICLRNLLLNVYSGSACFWNKNMTQFYFFIRRFPIILSSFTIDIAIESRRLLRLRSCCALSTSTSEHQRLQQHSSKARGNFCLSRYGDRVSSARRTSSTLPLPSGNYLFKIISPMPMLLFVPNSFPFKNCL